MKNKYMTYRTMNKTNDKLSILGYGCMRFPKKNGVIDESRTEKQIISAIKKGINYFDTAYIYPGSEKVLGKILAKGYRDNIKIATKLPIQMTNSENDMIKIFDEQLDRLQTNKIDYYLIHNINSFESWQKLKSIGIESFIEKKQKQGTITNIGFSFHGNLMDFKKIVDDYPWDFCQIQYNYMDINYQAGTEGLNYAYSKGLGIIIMEPLRGGTLAGKMPSSVKKILTEYKSEKKPAELALRWLWNHPEISVVLSGMNVEEHIEENIRVASNALPNSLTESELEMIDAIKEEFENKIKVSCTGCSYCMPCPHGVNIPYCFSMYNGNSMFGGVFSIYQYLNTTNSAGNLSSASQCKDCGICEKLCPQHIPIRKCLKDVVKNMEKAHYKAIVNIYKKFMYRK